MKFKGYRVKIYSYDAALIKKVDRLAVKSKIKFTSFVRLPNKTRIFVVIKSPHVNSKAKEHFKLTRFSRLFIFPLDLSLKQVKKFLMFFPSYGLVYKISLITREKAIGPPGNDAVR